METTLPLHGTHEKVKWNHACKCTALYVVETQQILCSYNLSYMPLSYLGVQTHDITEQMLSPE